MLGYAFVAVTIFGLIFYYFVIPIATYFHDPKVLQVRKLLLAFRHHRPWSLLVECLWLLDKRPHRSSQEEPNPGPNSLSFGDPRAIKDIYGHGTKCIKDLNDEVLKGSHSHVIDFVDKADHDRKRTLLSTAFAIKNLERWEFKIAFLTDRLIQAFDKLCTNPRPDGELRPNPADLTLDFNMWINL